MVSRWQSKVVVCEGGLDLSEDALTQGSVLPGSARVLQNYEPALEGGYRRINGYAKYSNTQVTGSTAKILGVKVCFDGVLAAAGTKIYHSTGTTWTAIQDSGASDITRPGTPAKTRFVSYYIGQERVVLTDGTDEAVRWDGTTATLIDGSGSGSGTPPADPKYCEFFLGRLCLAGYSANPSAVSISAPNDDLKFAAINGAVEIDLGDKVVGIKSFRDELYVFCENSIFKIVEDISTTFAVLDVVKGIGCLSTDSIQEIGGDLIFLAPDGLRSVAATARIGDVELGLLSRKIQPYVRSFVSSVSNANFSACIIRGKSQYRLFKYDSSVSESSSPGILGKLESGQQGIQYSWSTLKGISPFCCDSYYDSNTEVIVFGHPSDGYVYTMDTGNSFDGDVINAVYTSPQLTFDDATLRKILHKIDVYTQVEGDASTDLSTLFDFKDPDKLQTSPQTLSATGGVATYGTAVYDTDAYGAIQFPVFKKNLHGTGFTVAFQFTSSTSDKAPHRIDSFQIQYGLKGRK